MSLCEAYLSWGMMGAGNTVQGNIVRYWPQKLLLLSHKLRMKHLLIHVKLKLHQ